MKYLNQDSRLGGAIGSLAIGGVTVASILLVRNERFAVLSAWFLLLYVLYFIRTKLGYGFLSVPFLYISALGLFHLGLVVPWALGLFDLWDVWWFGYDDLTPPLALVALAVVGLQLGILFADWPASVNPRTEVKLAQPIFLENPTLLMVGLVLVALGIIAYVVGFFQVFGWQFFSLTYTESVGVIGDSDYRVFYFGLLFVPIGIYLALAGASKARLILPLGLLSIWAAWQLFTGVRNRALIVAAVAIYILVKKGVRIPRSFYVASLAAVLFIIPLVGLLREEVPTHRLTEVPLEDLNPLYGIMEMGASVWPLVGTYRLVNQTGFHYGSTYVTAVRMVFPARGLRYKLSGGYTGLWENLIPNLWFVASTSPILLTMNLGPSFTPIAEAYMNFGFPGVFVVFIAIGYVLVRLERIRIASAHSLAARAVIMGPLLWSVRSDTSVIARPLIWGLLCVGAAWLVARVIEGSSLTRAEAGAPRRFSRGAGMPAGQPVPRGATVNSPLTKKMT